jgi:hypothetical protein
MNTEMVAGEVLIADLRKGSMETSVHPSVTLAPGWDAGVALFGGYTTLTIECPGIAPDAMCPTASTVFPGGIHDMEVDPSLLGDDRALVIEIVTLLGAAQVHEALEWVRVDGRRICEPHPDDDGPTWDLFVTGIRQLVREFVATYPLS